LQIKASKSPKFRPGKSLKDALVVKVEEKAKKAPAKAKKA
jgi:hypothetical protein